MFSLYVRYGRSNETTRGGVEMTDIKLAEAVQTLYDIARQIMDNDGELAEDIMLCAERLNKMKPLLDGDLEQIKRAT